MCCWCHCLKNIGIRDRVSAINHLPKKRREHKRTDSCPESHSKSGEFETMIVFSVEGTGSMRRLCSPGHGIESQKAPALAKINYSNNDPNSHYQAPIMCVSQKLFSSYQPPSKVDMIWLMKNLIIGIVKYILWRHTEIERKNQDLDPGMLWQTASKMAPVVSTT